jgi:hypothetical protein
LALKRLPLADRGILILVDLDLQLSRFGPLVRQLAIGPADFDVGDFGIPIQSKHQCSWLLGQITPAGLHFCALAPAVVASDGNSCTNTRWISRPAPKSDARRPSAFDFLIFEGHDGPVVDANYDIGPAVTIDIGRNQALGIARNQ